MRILQVISHYVPAYNFGGPLHVAHSIGKSLVKQGHEVKVCTTNLKDPQRDLHVPLDTAVDVDGVQVFYERVHFSRYWGFSWGLFKRAKQEAGWADVLLLHFHYQFASVAGAWAARSANKPFIVFTHGSLNTFGISARGARVKKLYLRLLEGRNFRKAAFAAYHSPEEMEYSLKLGRSQVVPNGIDPSIFKWPEKGVLFEKFPELKGKTVFLYLGRLAQGKGLDLLLPAFAQVADSNMHLLVAGGDERGYEAFLRKRVAELKLEDRITFAGLLSGLDKFAALQDSNVFVLPSHSEGLSIAMLEAMYAGLPVITTNRVGLWKQIESEKCGFIVRLDENDLAASLSKMASSCERKAMGQRAKELVEKYYTWDIIVLNLISKLKLVST